MCSLIKFFKNKVNFEKMSDKEINRYITTLNREIEDKTVAQRISTQSNIEKDELYKKIKKRDDAIIFLEKRRDENVLH